MMALMSEDAIAMNTASESAARARLGPAGRPRWTVIADPSITDGISVNDATSDTQTSARARM